MPTDPDLHLRAFRKRAALSQTDLGRLLGHTSPASVCRLETGEHVPDFRTALMLEVIFEASASALFPTLFKTYAKLVRDRAEVLDDTLATLAYSEDVRHRRIKLDSIINRVDRLLA